MRQLTLRYERFRVIFCVSRAAHKDMDATAVIMCGATHFNNVYWRHRSTSTDVSRVSLFHFSLSFLFLTAYP